jgi:hypothetical protein
MGVLTMSEASQRFEDVSRPAPGFPAAHLVEPASTLSIESS